MYRQLRPIHLRPFIWYHVHFRPRHLRPVHLRPHLHEAFSFETTYIWDHIHLRPHSFETTFVWDHIHFTPRWSEADLIYCESHFYDLPFTYLRETWSFARWLFIWSFARLRPSVSKVTPFAPFCPNIIASPVFCSTSICFFSLLLCVLFIDKGASFEVSSSHFLQTAGGIRRTATWTNTTRTTAT